MFIADDERHFIAHVLAFFAASDGIVIENLAVRFMKGRSLANIHVWMFVSFSIGVSTPDGDTGVNSSKQCM